MCQKKDGIKRNQYNSEAEAKKAIAYVLSRYGNEMICYKCNNCGYWYLSPQDRYTPSSTSKCLDSNGKPKQAYPTREYAQKRANIIMKERGVKLFVYHCKECNEYHLSHKQF